MSASAIDVIDEVYLDFSDNFGVGFSVYDLEIYDTTVYHVAKYNVLFNNGDGWKPIPYSSETPCFAKDVSYRWELCLAPANTHLAFDSSHPPTVSAPYTGATITINGVVDDKLYLYMDLGTPIVVSPSMFFNDVHTTDWFYHDVEFVYDFNLMNGVGNGNFNPKGTCTRAMVVTVLYRLIGEPGIGGTCPFTDVKEGWYYKAVTWAQNCGVVIGKSATTFGPNDPITREQLATILYRFTKEVLGSEDLDGIMLTGFTDNGDISSYAGTPLSWAFGHGIIQGTDTETGKFLYPTNYAKRCEVAAILHRFCDIYAS